jgi:hypothetical protein
MHQVLWDEMISRAKTVSKEPNQRTPAKKSAVGTSTSKKGPPPGSQVIEIDKETPAKPAKTEPKSSGKQAGLLSFFSRK